MQKHTLLCCADVGVTGGVSVIVGESLPSLGVAAQGNLCSWTLASLETHCTKILSNTHLTKKCVQMCELKKST